MSLFSRYPGCCVDMSCGCLPVSVLVHSPHIPYWAWTSTCIISDYYNRTGEPSFIVVQCLVVAFTVMSTWNSFSFQFVYYVNWDCKHSAFILYVIWMNRYQFLSVSFITVLISLLYLFLSSHFQFCFMPLNFICTVHL